MQRSLLLLPIMAKPRIYLHS
uniref:Uncharacterized protein n=1 Tax=Rhizophora mucronata TaxID=61149 RepID=A0A2P2PSG3_RHIMU